MSESKITISRGKTVRSNKVYRDEVALDELDKQLQKPIIISEKENLPYICWANFRRNIRRKARLVEFTGIVIDYDGSSNNISEVSDRLGNIKHFTHTTHSHGIKRGKNHFRVHVPLENPAPVKEYGHYFDALTEKLNFDGLDNSCRKPEQPMYVSGCSDERKHLFKYSSNIDGEWFQPTSNNHLPTKSVKRNKRGLKLDKNVYEGNRNNSMVEFIGKLFWAGFSKEHVEHLALLHNSQFYNPPLNDQEVKNIVESINKNEGIFTERYKNFAFVKCFEKVRNLESGKQYSIRTFNLTEPSTFNGEPLLTNLIRKGAIHVVEEPCFAPGEEIIFERDNVKYVNTYKPPEYTPKKGNIRPLIEYFKKWLPNRKYRRILLSTIAFMVQHPEKKIRWMLIIKGGKGIGKTVTAEHIITPLLGRWNVSTPEASDVFESFNSWALDKQLIVFNELYVGSATKQKEKFVYALKGMITDDGLPAHLKGIDKYQVPNNLNIIAFTNNENVIAITPGERRFVMLRTEVEPPPQKYFDEIVPWLDNNIEAIAYYFLNYRYSIDPNRPPETDYTVETKEDSETVLQSKVKDLITELLKQGFSGVGQVTFSDAIKLRMVEAGESPPTSHEVREAFIESQGRFNDTRKISTNYGSIECFRLPTKDFKRDLTYRNPAELKEDIELFRDMVSDWIKSSDLPNFDFLKNRY